jgi:MFS family permease
MTYIVAGLAGLSGAALGWFLFAAAGGVVAGWLGVSNMEGGRGMVAVWGFAPIGAVGGLVLGLFLALRYHGGYAEFGAIAWRGGAVVAGIAAVVAVGIAARLYAMPNFPGNRSHPYLLFELRLPEAGLPADPRAIKVELHTDHNPLEALVTSESWREDGVARVFDGMVAIYHRTRQRMLVVKLKGADVLFDLGLARTPEGSASYGPWKRARFVFEPGAAAARAVRDDEIYEARWRVRWAGDD